MRKINNLLTLSSVQLNAYGSDSYLAQSSPAVELFDNRSEFCIDRRQSALAVLMTFTNEGCLMPEPCGVRRQVSATLIDATTDCLVNTSASSRSIFPKIDSRASIAWIFLLPTRTSTPTGHIK